MTKEIPDSSEAPAVYAAVPISALTIVFEAAALQMGFLTEDKFDRIVDPESVRPLSIRSERSSIALSYPIKAETAG